MASPRAGKVLESPPEEPTLEELFKRYDTRDPDELILRALMPEPDLQKMRAAGPVQRSYPVMSTPELEQARQLLKTARSPYVQIQVSRPKPHPTPLAGTQGAEGQATNHRCAAAVGFVWGNWSW